MIQSSAPLRRVAAFTSLPVPRFLTGVLFDLDGTMVDTEFLSPLAWGEVLSELGVKIPEGDDLGRVISAPSMRGANASKIADHLISSYKIGPDHSPQWMVKRKRELAVELVLTRGKIDLSATWFGGVSEGVRRLGAAMGVESVGLCTSNLRPIVAATLEAGEMSDAFGGGHTVQENMLDVLGSPQLKPNPAPYLRALKLLGRPSNEVAALEDSEVGVRSAVGAGVGVVIGVLNREGGDAAAENEEAAGALLAAGASGVFRTTAEAIEWCIDHSAAGAVPAVPPSKKAKTAGNCTAALLEEKESTVRRYFDGVNAQDPAMMASCFAESVELRDMCGPARGEPRTATSSEMADRCMEFLAAHPDCVVRFEALPQVDRGGDWVWCHWAETGTWSGESRGVAPKGTPLDVGGHTRFLLEERGGEQKIIKQVVYRTFSEWEVALR